MIKIHNLSTPILKKISKMPKTRSKRSTKPTVSVALVNACPLCVENRTIEALVDCKVPVSSKKSSYDNDTLEQSSSNESISNLPDASLKPFHPCYPDEKVFNAALELYNKQMENGRYRSSSGSKKWECKGKIRVSFQLCILCKDVGKVRSEMDTYYLNILEVRKYRTILCKGCLGYILHKHFGNALSEIETHLDEYKDWSRMQLFL